MLIVGVTEDPSFSRERSSSRPECETEKCGGVCFVSFGRRTTERERAARRVFFFSGCGKDHTCFTCVSSDCRPDVVRACD
jgi:hypothetical protein